MMTHYIVDTSQVFVKDQKRSYFCEQKGIDCNVIISISLMAITGIIVLVPW